MQLFSNNFNLNTATLKSVDTNSPEIRTSAAQISNQLWKGSVEGTYVLIFMIPNKDCKMLRKKS